MLRDGFRFGELGLGVDAAHVILLDFDRDGAKLHAARDLDRIRQIEFALLIIVTDARENLQRALAGQRHDAAVAEPDLALARRRIGFFANGEQLFTRRDQAAVAFGVGRAKCQHRDCGACSERRPQSFERRLPDQRRIAVDNNDVIGPFFESGLGREHRMSRAAPLVLNKNLRAGQHPPGLGGNGVMVRSDYHGGRGSAGTGHGGQHMGQQRAAGDLVQHLGQRRAHPCAFAGG